MGRYYFALKSSGTVRDEEREDLPDDTAALQVAQQTARDFAKNGLGNNGRVIQVFNEGDELVGEVPLVPWN